MNHVGDGNQCHLLCTSTMGIEVEAKYVDITRMIWMVLAS